VLAYGHHGWPMASMLANAVRADVGMEQKLGQTRQKLNAHVPGYVVHTLLWHKN